MEALIGPLRRDGFAVVRGLLDPDEIAAMAAAFDRLLDMARALDGTGEVDGTRFVLARDPFRLHRVVWVGGIAPELETYGADPRFVGIAAAVLGTPTPVQIIQQAHFKLPGDEVSFAWHQDASNRRYGTDLWRDVTGDGSFVQIALAVDGMSAANGGLRMIRGSHEEGFVAALGSGEIPAEHLAGEIVDLELEPGDAAVFGPFVIHGSGPNRGLTSRRLFLQGYAAPGANRREYPGCGLGVPRALPAT